METTRVCGHEPLQNSLDALLAEAESLGLYTEPHREHLEAVRRRLVEEIEDAKRSRRAGPSRGT